jgi:hypothetical protein
MSFQDLSFGMSIAFYHADTRATREEIQRDLFEFGLFSDFARGVLAGVRNKARRTAEESRWCDDMTGLAKEKGLMR